MTIIASVGKAQSFNATEAAIQATDEALSQIGRHRVALAIIAASHDFPGKQVVDGVSGLLSDTPLFGFSTPAQLTEEGIHQRSVVVALIAGDRVVANAGFWKLNGNFEHERITPLSKLIQPGKEEPGTLLIVGDGTGVDGSQILDYIPPGNYPLGGCLTCGDSYPTPGFQIGGIYYDSLGLAGVHLGGDLKVGIGSNHGWQPIGVFVRITQAKELRLRALDGKRASEVYSRMFGYSSRDWTYPPLNRLVRLYPWGIEEPDQQEKHLFSYSVRSPIQMEADGSLRMNPGVAQGKTAQLLISSVENCVAAAKLAARQALQQLGGAKPVLGLVFADIAWRIMLQAQPGSEVEAIREIIGSDVPLIGGYSYGQFMRNTEGKPELLNQHLQVVLFGSP